jgi:hypothetical protein
MADRDKRASQPKSPLKRAVSASESNDLNRQHPADSRAFPDPSSNPSGRSLHPEPGWRWTQSPERIRTAEIGNRGIPEPRRPLSPEPAVSTSGARSPSPKTPRNRVFFRVDRRCERRVSAHADSMAVDGVWGQLVSGGGGSLGRTRLCGPVPVKQGKYREPFLRAGKSPAAIPPPRCGDRAKQSAPELEQEIRVRPFWEVPATRQITDFISDFGRLTFGTLRVQIESGKQPTEEI